MGNKDFCIRAVILILSVGVFILIFHGPYYVWNFMFVRKSRFLIAMVEPLFSGENLIISFAAASVAIISLSCCVFLKEAMRG